MFKRFLSVVTAFAVAVPAAAFAALAPADEALITTGIASSDASFYKLAGAIMIVMAGIWGVKKVIGLLGGK